MKMPNEPRRRGVANGLPTRRRIALMASAAVLAPLQPVPAVAADAPPAPSRQYISFEARIDETTTSRLIAIVGAAIQRGVGEIHLIVGTGGGSISAALLIYHFLRSLPATVTAYNLSTIQSAGEIIFLAGEKRVATDNAVFMFHQPRQNVTGNPSLTLDDLKDRENYLAIDLKRVDDIYRERTSLSPAQLEEFRQHAVYFDAAAARAAGIIQEIAPLTIPPRSAITAINPKE